MFLTMKDLNDRLARAYSTVIELNAHGEAYIRDFDYMNLLTLQAERSNFVVWSEDCEHPKGARNDRCFKKSLVLIFF